MAERYLELTLKIKMIDLPYDERKECWVDMGSEKGYEIPKMNDYEPTEFAEIIADHVQFGEELWAGTDIYAKVDGVDFVGAKWVSDLEGEEPIDDFIPDGDEGEDD